MARSWRLVGEPGVGKSRLVWEFIAVAPQPADGSSSRVGSVSYGRATALRSGAGPAQAILRDRRSRPMHPPRAREGHGSSSRRLDRAPGRRPSPPMLADARRPSARTARSSLLEPPHRKRRILDGDQATPGAPEPGAASPAGLRGPALDRFRDPGGPRHASSRACRPPGSSCSSTIARSTATSGAVTDYYAQLRVDPLRVRKRRRAAPRAAGRAGADLEPLSQLLIERTEGNPLLPRGERPDPRRDRHVLVGEPGAYRLASPLEAIQMPATVQAVLAARIDRLPPEA